MKYEREVATSEHGELDRYGTNRLTLSHTHCRHSSVRLNRLYYTILSDYRRTGLDWIGVPRRAEWWLASGGGGGGDGTDWDVGLGLGGRGRSRTHRTEQNRGQKEREGEDAAVLHTAECSADAERRSRSAAAHARFGYTTKRIRFNGVTVTTIGQRKKKNIYFPRDPKNIMEW